MGAIGDMVGGAVGSALGMSSGTHLKDFLNHFSPSDGKWIQTIDPKTTFDLKLRFYPCASEPKESDWLDSLGSSLAGMAGNALNNVTGGLLGAWANNKKSITDQHDKFEKAGTETFMEFLAQANLLVGQNTFGAIIGESEVQCPTEIDLGLYCQDVTLPQLEIPDQGQANTLLGDFPILSHVVKTNGNKVTLGILNTRVPLIERIFYPWMREVTLPYWSYNAQPYTTATMTIDFTKHADIKYVFLGCRPTYVNLISPNQQNTEIKRQVTMTFDLMYVDSKLQNSETLLGKLLGSAGTIVNSAATMVNL